MEGARLSVAPVQDFAQMGRSVARSGKAKVKKTLLATQPAYSASQLLEKAEELLATCEFDLAKQFCTRALETEPDHAAALEMLADVEIELGNEDQAMQHLLRAAALPNPAPSIYLYLAQLAETPQEALQHFGTAYTLLSSRLENAAGSPEEAELRRSASRALIGMTELYLTDLCFEADAEQKCTEYLDQAALVDPTDSEIYQTLASVRLSQHKIDEARQALQRAWSIWKDEPEGGTLIPPFASRVALAKLFIETEQFSAAYDILIGLENEDEEDAQVQYLLGLNLFLKLEPTIDAHGSLDGDNLRLGTEAQNFLQHCVKMQGRNEQPEQEDRDMIEHVAHMLQKLGKAGVVLQVDEESDQEEAEWEDEDDLENGATDVEMAN